MEQSHSGEKDRQEHAILHQQPMPQPGYKGGCLSQRVSADRNGYDGTGEECLLPREGHTLVYEIMGFLFFLKHFYLY